MTTPMSLSPDEIAEIAELAAVARRLRHEACDFLHLPRQTRFVTCAAHGQRGRVEEVYAMNSVCRDADGAITCLPDHPYCFAWASPDLPGAEMFGSA